MICIVILLTGLLKITVKLPSSFISIVLNNITTPKYIPSVDIARTSHTETWPVSGVYYWDVQMV
jgi:hypothetical protein